MTAVLVKNSIYFSLISIFVISHSEINQTHASERLKPRILLALMVRNKAHTLPYSLNYIEKLNYPKERIVLWIRSDHNSDNSTEIINLWLDHVETQYHKVDFEFKDSPQAYSDEKGPCDWSEERNQYIIRLRQQALDTARQMWADYIFFTDLDNFLLNPEVLNDLIAQEKTIVAPMLNATASEWYANFWGDMDENGYYKRSPNYKEQKMGNLQGCMPVANVHSTFLIDLGATESQNLAFYPLPPGYIGPIDDIIIFAQCAKHFNILMHILNTDFYGFMLIPMESYNSVSDEKEQFLHLRLEGIVFDLTLEKLDYVYIPPKPKSKLGFDQIYMINLLRRPDRRQKMLACFVELGIDAEIVDAVDGKKMSDESLEGMGVSMLNGYADPYHNRPLTRGEIGCFLSHYIIWQDMVKNNYEKIIVFEDDIRFEIFFLQKLAKQMREIEALHVQWELMYIGRKKLKWREEEWIKGSETLVYAHYSYWTLSYALTLQGARKLLNQDPIKKMVPVDEYLPIMFDKHPTEEWSQHFSPRNLVALSVEPLLVYPTHYTGEPGYFTDTDDSEIVEHFKGEEADQEEINGKGDVGEIEIEALKPKLEL